MHGIFLTLVVLNLVAGFQVLGTLMSVGLMMLPAASARFWSRHLVLMLGAAMLMAVLSAFTGLVLSLALFTAGRTGGGVECRNVVFLSILTGPCGGILRRH